jgi:rifampicin phosphotransferase
MFHYIEQWHSEWRPEMQSQIADFAARDLRALSDEELLRHFDLVVDMLRNGNDRHFLLHGSIALPLAELAFFCRDELGWDDLRTLELFSGLSGQSTAPTEALAELAALARENSSLADLLKHPDQQTHARLAEVDADFAARFDDYQRAYGCRALRYELSEPTLAEEPQLMLKLLADQLTAGYDPATDAAANETKREARRDEAREALAAKPQATSESFERLLERATIAYPVREENEFYTVSAPYALVRYVLVEIGRRLDERGRIDLRDDVFFLEHTEIVEALKSSDSQQELVRRRKGERLWVEAHPGPASYGEEPGPPPAFDVLPALPRFAMEAILWYTEVILAQGDDAGVPALLAANGGGSSLKGIAASPGKYAGPARIVFSEDDFGKIRAGDVLVCPITSPVWSVIFPSVGALVTDSGGILSHPAIIAREYRVPAVLATGNATSTLTDGQLVIVDGEAGTVTVNA